MIVRCVFSIGQQLSGPMTSSQLLARKFEKRQ
jgi:hypothetical protein